MIESAKKLKGLREHYNCVTRFIENNVLKGLGNKVAIYCENDSLTYQELLTKVNQFGNALKNIGVEPENRVLILSYDSPEFIVLFLVLSKLGRFQSP